jgi:hypothetical protein
MERAVILSRLEAHLEAGQFQGVDPFDGLNSPLVRALTLGNRLLGVAALQFFKRSPVNLRPLFGIRPGINPKAHGLFTAGYVWKYRRTGAPGDLARAQSFAGWLVAHPSPGASGAAWGYNFDWPNRNAFFPAGTPTIVNTAFIVHALLDLHAVDENPAWRAAAISATDFILRDLARSPGPGGGCFAYTPLDRARIHNANLLGAALLARVGARESRDDLRAAAREATGYTLAAQREDGAWWYGDEPKNRWIDSYHTGYNLLALEDIARADESATGVPEALARGYDYYLDHFFTEDGLVRYYADQNGPYDAHAAAHALLTLHRLQALRPDRSRALLERVWARTVEVFWDERRGCFHYLYHRGRMNRIDYFRWVQAWMFRALQEWAAAPGAPADLA